MFKSKVLFASGLFMSALAVVLLLFSGFNFKDLRPQSWKNLNTVHAAGSYKIEGTELITKARGFAVLCNLGTNPQTNKILYVYLGPSEIQKTMHYKDASGKELLGWTENYAVSEWRDWTSNPIDKTNLRDIPDPDWRAVAYNQIRPGGTDNLNFSNPSQSQSCYGGQSSDVFYQGAGLYYAGQGGDRFSSLPLAWNVSVSF